VKIRNRNLLKQIVLLLLILKNINIYSQQNFINVPSAEVTLKHKLFFQQQVNFNELIQSNSTLDFGLGSGFEVGINILGLNFNNKHQTFQFNDSNFTDPYNPLVLINGLKQFTLSKRTSISIGSQLGLNFTDDKKTSQAGLVYTNFKINDFISENTSLVIGGYYNSLHYGGEGNRFGAWLVTEIPLNKRFHIMAESILGYNALSYTSLGIIYYPLNWLPLTFGVQIPNTKKNAYSIVFELTLIPLHTKAKQIINYE
jgi:hypothetical protein